MASTAEATPALFGAKLLRWSFRFAVFVTVTFVALLLMASPAAGQEAGDPAGDQFGIEGLADDRFAVFCKTHHATIDGAAGVELLTMLMDDQPDTVRVPPEEPAWSPERAPGEAEMVLRTMVNFARSPERMARANYRLARGMAKSLRADGVADGLKRMRDAADNDLGRAWRMMENLDYGMVAINEGVLSTEVAPFGGVKQSGMGREGSKYGLDDYIDVKYGLIGGI